MDRLKNQELLFGEQSDFSDFYLEEQTFCYASLCRTNRLAGKYDQQTRQLLDNLPDIINNVLQNNQANQLLNSQTTDNDHSVIFNFIDSESQELVSEIVTAIYKNWLRAEVRQNKKLEKNNNLFNPELITETAASVIKAISNTKDKLNLNKPPEKIIFIKLMSYFGPDFTEKWLDQTIVNQWLETLQMDESDKEKYRHLLSTGNLKKLSQNTINNPIELLNKIRDNLENELSDENIVRLTGWPINEVKTFFTFARKSNIAVNNLMNPLKTVDTIRDNLENKLSDENIVQLTGWPISKVQQVFPLATKKNIAISNIKNPKLAVLEIKEILDVGLSDENIVQLTGWPISKVQQVFPLNIKRRFIINNPKTYIDAIAKIKNNLEVLLTYEKIAQLTNWKIEDVKKIITPSLKLRLAIDCMNDPEISLIKFLNSERSFGSKRDHAKDEALKKLGLTPPKLKNN